MLACQESGQLYTRIYFDNLFACFTAVSVTVIIIMNIDEFNMSYIHLLKTVTSN